MSFFEGGARKKGKKKPQKKKTATKKKKKTGTKGKKGSTEKTMEMNPWDEMMYGMEGSQQFPQQYPFQQQFPQQYPFSQQFPQQIRENQIYGVGMDPMFGATLGESKLFSGFPIGTSSILGVPDYIQSSVQQTKSPSAFDDAYSAISKQYVPDDIKNRMPNALQTSRPFEGIDGPSWDGGYYEPDSIFDGDALEAYKRHLALTSLSKYKGDVPTITFPDSIEKSKASSLPSSLGILTNIEGGGKKKKKPAKKTTKKKGGMKTMSEEIFG